MFLLICIGLLLLYIIYMKCRDMVSELKSNVLETPSISRFNHAEEFEWSRWGRYYADVSISRQYVIAFFDQSLICYHVSAFTLPDGYTNNSGSATYYYMNKYNSHHWTIAHSLESVQS